MAIAFNGNNYAGTVERRMLTRLMTGNEVVSGGHLHIVEGVQDRHTITRLEASNIIQGRVPTPTTQGTLEIQHRQIVVGDYMIYIEFNPNDFEGHWYEQLFSGNIVFRELPAIVREQFVDEIASVHDTYLGEAIWTSQLPSDGGVAPFDKFTGIIPIAASDPETILTPSPVALTDSNIISKLAETYAQLPKAVRNNPGLKCLMSTNTFELYGDALRALDYKSISHEQATPNSYKGKRVTQFSAFPDDCLFWVVTGTDKQSNLWMGTNLYSDTKTVQVEKLQANSELWFFKMLVKVGLQVAKPAETVLYYVGPEPEEPIGP